MAASAQPHGSPLVRPAQLLLVAVIALLGVSPPAHAQFWDAWRSPKLSVPITHPPGLGLKIQRVAFKSAEGRCSSEFLDSLVEDFVQNGVEVIDRQHLDSIFAEHDLNSSGYVDQATAAKLGKVLDATALVFVKVQRCDTKQTPLYRRWQDGQRNWHLTYTSRTDAFFKASVQTVDLQTGRIFSAKTLEANESKENQSDAGTPEFPDPYLVQDLALHGARDTVHRMFFTWSETRELVYYDDKTCNLQASFSALAHGDRETAVEMAEQNLERCKAEKNVKPRQIGRAYYDAGVANFVLSRFDKALELLNEAARLHPGDIAAQAIAGCRDAQRLARDMQRLEERMPMDATRATTTAAPVTAPAIEAHASGAAAGGRADAATDGGKGESLEGRLAKLKQLLNKGLISESDYNSQKQKLLAAL